LHKFRGSLVFVITVKHILPRVAAMENMVVNPSDGSSSGSCLVHVFTKTAEAGKPQQEEGPLFSQNMSQEPI
jgi:hypothetical protein